MLDWYAQRVGNAASLVMMTLAFNVDEIVLDGLNQDLPSMRLALLENEPTEEIEEAEREHRGRLAFSNGSILGKTFIKYARGGAKVDADYQFKAGGMVRRGRACPADQPRPRLFRAFEIPFDRSAFG